MTFLVEYRFKVNDVIFLVFSRWSNPVLDRLTGGMGNHILANQQHKQNGHSHAAAANGLRNDSYYMATNDTWSPMGKNNSVLIEDDSDPLAPYVTHFLGFLLDFLDFS